MKHAEAVEQGREAFTCRQWRLAHARLAAADEASPLACDDLERLAVAAHLLGRDSETVTFWTRAHHRWIDEGLPERAARCGFWMSLNSLLRGETAKSAGWLARVQRLIDACDTAVVEQGYAEIIRGLMALGKADCAAAKESFEGAVESARRFREPDLLAFGLLGSGQASLESGAPDGMVLIDEAMVGVAAGEVSPIASGIVYCAVILASQSVFDVKRGQEWTMALNEWCASQPDLVAFGGQCLVHRSELLQLRGEWGEALEEARRACQRFGARPERFGARAAYQQAELHRVRGEIDLAEAAYREAARLGYEPQPGLALLRLAQGRIDAAAAAIRSIVEPVGMGRDGGSARQVRMLGPYVAIMLAAGDGDAAQKATEALREIVERSDAPVLRAWAAQARGAVLLAGGDAKTALGALREAWTTWQQLEAPYEAARVRVLIGRASRQLGDHDTAELHVDAARSIFERLGARLDLAELEREPKTTPQQFDTAARLTTRERQVLALVASGRTNRQIAAELGISEHTVARHVSNIFDKLGVGSRTAASAFAFEHGLVKVGDRAAEP